MSRKSKTHARRSEAVAASPPRNTPEAGKPDNLAGSKSGDPLPPTHRHRKFIVLGVCLLLTIATWVVFGQTLRHEFVNLDDNIYVYENGHVLAGLTWAGLGRAFKSLEVGFWHPLTWISLMADAQIYGPQAWGYHLTNLVLHVASTVLLFLVLKRITGALWQSALVAALFALHPLHVESVAWVAERKDALSTLFWMLTLLFYARYATGPGARNKSATFDYCLALIFFTCGLMSKAMVMTLPVVMLLLDYWPLGRVSGVRCQLSGLTQHATRNTQHVSRLLWEKAPFLAVSFVSGLLTLYAERAFGALSFGAHLPVEVRAANAAVSCVRYLWQTVCPINLAVFYPYPKLFSPWLIFGALLLIVLITIAGLWLGRRHPYLAVGWLWYGITLLPVSGLIQVGEHAYADRYTYVPLIGVFIMVVWGMGAVCARWRVPGMVTRVVAALVLVACAARSSNQLRNWHNSESLWTHALSCTSGTSLAHNNLGNALVDNGRVNEAIANYKKAIEITPNYADAHYNLGNAFFKTGRRAEAIANWRKAIEIKPNHAEAHNNLGLAFFTTGRRDEAIARWQKAIEIKPNYADAHGNLGSAFSKMGRRDEAIAHWQRAVEIHPQSLEVRNNLAWALATGPVASLRNGGQAITLAEQSNQLAGGKNPQFLATLAAAYAEAGRFSNAVATARHALHLATEQNNQALTDKLRKQMDLYKSGFPCRDDGRTVAPAPKSQ